MLSKITSKPVSTVDSITKRSEKIFSLFSQTKIDCEALNSEINQMVTNKETEAQRILDEAKELKNIAAKNDNLAKKIEAFINS